MNKFKLRPAYGSNELLIEFTSGPENGYFITQLEKALSPINVIITSSVDLWINDDMIFEVNSDLGDFKIIIDNWYLGFIISKKNPEVIKKIDSLLNENVDFKKEIINFKDYELKK